MKSFKVFEHSDNSTKEIEFTEHDSASEVAETIRLNIYDRLTSKYFLTDNDYIKAEISNHHSSGHATTFSIYTSVVDYDSQINRQETIEYTVVEIQKED